VLVTLARILIHTAQEGTANTARNTMIIRSIN
jgi:hypothetical protein